MSEPSINPHDLTKEERQASLRTASRKITYEAGFAAGYAAAVAKLREEADAEEKECGIATDYVRHLRAGALVLERAASTGE